MSYKSSSQNAPDRAVAAALTLMGRRCAQTMIRAIVCTFLLAHAAFAEWPGVPFNEVRAYAWPSSEPMRQVILAEMKLAEGVINKDGARLSEQQTWRLLSAQARRFKERPVAGCHIPHNAFVFYDAQQKPVAFLEVCFDCLTSRASPKDPESDPDFVALATICAELHLPFGQRATIEELRAEIDWILDPAHTTNPKAAPPGDVPSIPGLEPIHPK